jgi:dephospho-CoA kinase
MDTMAMTPTSTPRLICICGQKRSGKDTVAKFLEENYGYKNEKIAGALKDTLMPMFSFTPDQLETDLKEVVDPRWNITPRQAMQFVGTDLMQYKIQELMPHIGRKFWIQSFIQKHLANNEEPIVISDIRFIHEYEELQAYNPLVVRVVRYDDTTHTPQKQKDNHVSETEFENIPADIILLNNGSLEHFIENMHYMFTFLDL